MQTVYLINRKTIKRHKDDDEKEVKTNKVQ